MMNIIFQISVSVYMVKSPMRMHSADFADETVTSPEFLLISEIFPIFTPLAALSPRINNIKTAVDKKVLKISISYEPHFYYLLNPEFILLPVIYLKTGIPLLIFFISDIFEDLHFATVIIGKVTMSVTFLPLTITKSLSPIRIRSAARLDETIISFP